MLSASIGVLVNYAHSVTKNQQIPPQKIPVKLAFRIKTVAQRSGQTKD